MSPPFSFVRDLRLVYPFTQNSGKTVVSQTIGVPLQRTVINILFVVINQRFTNCFTFDKNGPFTLVT